MDILAWLRPSGCRDDSCRIHVERAIKLTDPLIATVADYERRLAPAVGRALDYCDSLVAAIPGPVEISRAAFAADPLVHALFGSSDQVEEMLATSRCVREHLVAADSVMPGQCFALLGMRRREKAGFGPSLTGEIVTAEAPMTWLYFTDHTLAEPSPEPQALSQRLREAMFDGLLKSLVAAIETVRAEQAELRQGAALEQARSRYSGDEAHTRHLEELRQRLRSQADALQPARLLDTLVDCLNDPAPYLRLDPVTLSVDRSGVLCHEAPPPADADTLRLAELTSRDQRRWVVMTARIDRDEARRAAGRVAEARRHIVF